MSANRFFTILFIPEKTENVRKIIIPTWVFRSMIVGLVFAVLFAIVMGVDYGYIMGQIGENRQLRTENRRMKQQLQILKSKMESIDGTMDRIRTFSTRLKVITNIEDRGSLIQSLNQNLPDANTNIGTAVSSEQKSLEAELADAAREGKSEYDVLLTRSSSLALDSSVLEQTLHDQYELLADKKAFLSALPTRKPAVGYFTSGFGIRRDPFGSRDKMHEGLDIANYPGTPIKATADGSVVFADSKAGYGRTVILDHGYGLETLYAHAQKLLVKKGQRVKRGEPIAHLGNSGGRSTGPHVHYEVHINGTPIDPLSYILEN